MKFKDIQRHFQNLFIALFACVTLTACGGDDDEPDGPSTTPNTSFLYGTWTSKENSMTIKADGTIEATFYDKYTRKTYDLLGKWSYHDGILSIESSTYLGDEFVYKGKSSYTVFYDEHIKKLILKFVPGGDAQELDGQYTKTE